MSADTSFRDAISMVLGASLPLGAHNLAICIRQAYQTKTWINIVQCVASFFQVLNQIGFILQFTQPADTFFKNDCRWLSSIADAFFFGFQILSVGVLIMRTTALVPSRYQNILRGVFFATLIVAVSFLLYSAVVKTNLILGNRCAAIYDRQSNVIGKIIVFGIYFVLLLVFTVPAFKHVTANRKAGLGKAGTTGYLIKIIMSVSLRICLAIIGFLLTVVLSFAGVWGDYFFIEFTVQNYFGITASTFDSATDAASSSGGAVSTRSGNGVARYHTSSGELPKSSNGAAGKNLSVWDHPTKKPTHPKRTATSASQRSQQAWGDDLEESRDSFGDYPMTRRGTSGAAVASDSSGSTLAAHGGYGNGAGMRGGNGHY
ncbi:hypothetical protein HDU67_004972 [Dinochytrium kinnereticum]|nr:hypothetical protein HDU67_004972 [Dinochytrium kinnereticum]